MMMLPVYITGLFDFLWAQYICNNIWYNCYFSVNKTQIVHT